ncbi:hypothetical protein D3C84_1259310 [compost metagenome]
MMEIVNGGIACVRSEKEKIMPPGVGQKRGVRVWHWSRSEDYGEEAPHPNLGINVASGVAVVVAKSILRPEAAY